MKSILLSILMLVITSSMKNYGSVDNDDCTPSSERAKRAVEFFLQMPHLADFRVETGTENLTLSQIKHVSDPRICSRLKTLVNSNLALQNKEAGTIRTMYFYQAGGFYFIFYDYNKIRTGYTDFNVIGSDFKILGTYLI